MAKYIVHKLSKNIKATTQDIENGVSGKFADASVIGAYFENVSTAALEGIGDIVMLRTNQNATGYLKCDGSLFLDSEYPELADLLKSRVEQGVHNPFTSQLVSVSNATASDAGKHIAISRNDEFVAVTNAFGGDLLVYQTSDWTLLSSTLEPVNAAVNAVEFSPTQDIMVSTRNGQDVTTSGFAVYDTNTWARTVYNFPSGYETAVPIYSSFSGDGRYLAITMALNDTLIYETENWTLVHTLTSGIVSQRECSYSPNGIYLAVCGTNPNSVEIYETSEWTLVASETYANAVDAISFSPDGREIFVCYGNLLQQYRMDEGAFIPARIYTGNYPNSVSYAPDSSYVFTSSTTAPYLNVLSNQEYSNSLPQPPAAARYVRVSPKGKYVAYIESNYGLRVRMIQEDVPAGYTRLPDFPIQKQGTITLHPMIKASLQ